MKWNSNFYFSSSFFFSLFRANVYLNSEYISRIFFFFTWNQLIWVENWWIWKLSLLINLIIANVKANFFCVSCSSGNELNFVYFLPKHLVPLKMRYFLLKLIFNILLLFLMNLHFHPFPSSHHLHLSSFGWLFVSKLFLPFLLCLSLNLNNLVQHSISPFFFLLILTFHSLHYNQIKLLFLIPFMFIIMIINSLQTFVSLHLFFSLHNQNHSSLKLLY